jgi:anti-anti-sigma regulatory factor
MPDPLEFHTHAGADGFRIAVRGEIDMATVCDLEARAKVVLERLEPRVFIDCHEVTFIDSTGWKRSSSSTTPSKRRTAT